MDSPIYDCPTFPQSAHYIEFYEVVLLLHRPTMALIHKLNFIIDRLFIVP